MTGEHSPGPAAPDLLAASEEYTRNGDGPCVDDLMKAAIAKAQGES